MIGGEGGGGVCGGGGVEWGMFCPLPALREFRDVLVRLGNSLVGIVGDCLPHLRLSGSRKWQIMGSNLMGVGGLGVGEG